MASGRGNFSSGFAVIMALAGSAIGLGNLWRFPYMAGRHGGAAFIIIYIGCSLLISLPIFFSESIIGKSTGLGTFGALEKTAPGMPWKAEGYIALLASFVVLSFYSVVGGWSVDYLVRSVATGFGGLSYAQASGIFRQMSSSSWEQPVCLLVFLSLTSAVVAGGIDKGIGRFSKVMMPLLFAMIVVIVVRSVTLPGAREGIDYLVKPDFSKIDGPAVAAALGQSFFSLSLGVGCVLTYSSYMRKEQNLFATGLWTALFDTLFALMAGFAIMPAVFSAGLEPTSGPSLVYETLPVIFSQMGPLVPVIFFFAILIAAITSSISMMEDCVAFMVDQKGWKRGRATLLCFALALVLGCLCAFFPKIFNTCDFLTSNVFMMAGALVFSLVVGWKMPRSRVEAVFCRGRAATAAFPLVWFLIKWVAPVAIVLIAVTNLL